MTIIYHELDELARKEYWVEKSFIQDFLIPGIIKQRFARHMEFKFYNEKAIYFTIYFIIVQY